MVSVNDFGLLMADDAYRTCRRRPTTDRVGEMSTDEAATDDDTCGLHPGSAARLAATTRRHRARGVGRRAIYGEADPWLGAEARKAVSSCARELISSLC
jgi:hypothetical protein